ncbi:MAG: serine hydrolase domain-containing protein [Kofleriaceae bacterium]
MSPPASQLDDLHDALDAVRTAHGLPAIAAMVWRDGAPVAAGVAGVRRAEDPASLAQRGDRWHLGSNTKAMTATLLGIFVERGTVRWESTIGELFRGEKIDPSYAAVTLEQLVRHLGGAPGNPPTPVWMKLWADGAEPGARLAFVRSILAQPVAQPPGTFAYSNAGYMIAGAALERATGRTWEQLLRDELFAPLGMASCGFGPPGSAGVSAPDQPWGHNAQGASIAPGPLADNPPGLGPAGTVHCSLEDYGKFLAIHGGAPGLVSEATRQRLHTPPEGASRYAGGWSVASSGKYGEMLVHSGSNTMWYATTVVIPAQRLVIAVATNRGAEGVDQAIPPLLAKYGKPAPAP